MKYLYNPPKLIKKIFNNIVWNSNNGIILTFDDGPIPKITEDILDKLDEIGVKAIFFTVGENIKRYPNIAKSIVERGHQIGNHSYNHSKTSLFEPFSVQKEKIVKSNKIIYDNFGIRCKLYRPPHGRFNLDTLRIVKDLNMDLMLWSCLTYDYTGDFNKVKKAFKYLNKKSIITFHDSIKSGKIVVKSIDSLNKIVKDRNYRYNNDHIIK
ncbi:MAG: hypothetical protein CR982_09245 [Candidatus Cloacimonadota bacterium]|nr:MAG: hypothetical protein CR982_09245 [Candidatus Cloacimonadota bacterium]PIE77494.1 MAG: hypothetical protein CSA15_12535 [Candidatus Delongbacteria bacterium]